MKILQLCFNVVNFKKRTVALSKKNKNVQQGVLLIFKIYKCATTQGRDKYLTSLSQVEIEMALAWEIVTPIKSRILNFNSFLFQNPFRFIWQRFKAFFSGQF